MLVYRIENSKRQGPYHSSQNALAENSLRNISEPRHPEPRNDLKLSKHLKEAFGEYGTIDFPESYRFGFSSLEQARKWLCRKSWCKSLRKNGFTLAAFEVPDEFCIQGDKQVMYQARRVKRSTRKTQCIMESLWTKN